MDFYKGATKVYKVGKDNPMMNCETVLMICELWSDDSMQVHLEDYRKITDAMFCLVTALNSCCVNTYICSTVPCQTICTMLFQTTTAILYQTDSM